MNSTNGSLKLVQSVTILVPISTYFCIKLYVSVFLFANDYRMLWRKIMTEISLKAASRTKKKMWTKIENVLQNKWESSEYEGR